MNSDQVFTEIRATGSDITINYFYNSEMREHMFDKVLTPSDVGKLNRLVIPKQHAENYFSLEENQQETVLDFQDRNGKMWRFRYCYWTSSQSYVITRGWNRFVKEKKLSAGDITSFHRGYIPDSNEPEQRRKIMFIDWRHRADFNNMYQHNFIFGSPTNLPEYSMPSYRSYPPFYQGYGGYGRIVNGGRFYAGSPMDHHQWNVGRYEPLVYDSVPVFQVPPPPQPSTAKKLRLFGVDVEESSSSGETRGEMGVVGYSPSSPVVTRDDGQSSWRLPRGEMGASSSLGLQLSDDEAYKRKGKSLQF